MPWTRNLLRYFPPPDEEDDDVPILGVCVITIISILVGSLLVLGGGALVHALWPTFGV